MAVCLLIALFFTEIETYDQRDLFFHKSLNYIGFFHTMNSQDLGKCLVQSRFSNK